VAVERDRVVFVELLRTVPVLFVELYVRLVPLLLLEIAELLPELVALTVPEEVPEGRVLLVMPSVPSDVLVPLELMMFPVLVPLTLSEYSFVLLYPCLEDLLPYV
jgi:hypothetical protein